MKSQKTTLCARKRGLIAFGLILLAIALCACATPAKLKPGASASGARQGAAPGTAILTAKVWYLSGFRAGSLFVPIRPGEGSSAVLILKADGRIEGNTGINQFAGTWALGKKKGEIHPFSARVKPSSAHSAPNETAAAFDRAIVRLLGESKTVTIKKDSISLANGRDEILLEFIHY